MLSEEKIRQHVKDLIVYEAELKDCECAGCQFSRCSTHIALGALSWALGEDKGGRGQLVDSMRKKAVAIHREN